MSEELVLQVKNLLVKQYYFTNDSWLTECIEYFLDEHPDVSFLFEHYD